VIPLPAGTGNSGRQTRAERIRAGRGVAQTSCPDSKPAKVNPLKKLLGKKSPEETLVGEVVEEEGKKPAGTGKKMLLVVVVALLLLALAVGAFFMFSGNGSTYPSFDTMYPTGESLADPTGTPGVTPSQQPTTAPATQQPPAEQSRWDQFLALNKSNGANRGPFLDKPAHLLDIFKHFPTRWFLWLIFLLPIWSLLKADRFAAREKTDVRSAQWGLVALFGGVVLAGPIAALVEYVVVAFSGTITSATWPYVFCGIAMNLIVQWVASTSGRTDYSAFSIAGLFFSGAVIVWWFTPSIPLIILGSVMMAGGIVLQHYEMYRTHQGWKAEFTTLIILIVFALMTMLVYWLVGLVPVISPNMAWIVQFGIALLFESRLFLGAIVGLLVAYSVGDQISTAIMPPAIAEGTALTSDHATRRDDLQGSFDVNARFDAMAYAIMLLYPLAALLWYLAIFL
jgi:hypothetical protein